MRHGSEAQARFHHRPYHQREAVALGGAAQARGSDEPAVLLDLEVDAGRGAGLVHALEVGE